MFQAAAASTFITIFGARVSDTISGSNALTPTPHNWVADSTGLYQTTTNLAAEWLADYKTMLAGKGSTLDDIQRLEGNADAVFLNTGLSKLSAATQARDREDVQREFDAIGAAMKLAGIDDAKPLTEQTYLLLERTIQGNATLEELAMQGHGLNNSGISRYAGYTNDFQNNVDGTTLFVGGGVLNNNSNAIADFFDDNVLSHLPFPVVWRNGALVQLNQNGDAENGLNQAIVALNDSMVSRTYVRADFSTTWPTLATLAATRAGVYTVRDYAQLAALAQQEAAPAPSGQIKTLYGVDIANTMTFNLGNGITHRWTAGANGLFTTTTDLATEWYNAYVAYVTTGGTGLTAEQRLEANAESVFLNTGLARLGKAQLSIDRQDAQREFDAMFGAMKEAGVNPNVALTDATYLRVERALRNDPALQELAIQGYGLVDPPSATYNGFVNDFENNVDDMTIFKGPGPLGYSLAIGSLFAMGVMSYVVNPTIVINGNVVQLDENGDWGISLNDAVSALDQSIGGVAYNAQDYGPPA